MPREDANLIWLDSPEEYADYVQNKIPRSQWCTNSSLFAGRNMNEALDVLRHGDTKNLSRAEKIIQDMQDQEIFSIGLPMPVRCVHGYYPHVPSAIANHPKSMKRRVENDQIAINTPIRIFVETTVSTGVTTDQLTNRGIAALGFIMAMNLIRPVELYCLSVGYPKGVHTNTPHFKACGSVVKIASKPVDLQRACFMLTDVAYARRIACSAMYHMRNMDYKSNIHWAWSLDPRLPQYQAQIREMLDLTEHDVVLYGGYIDDKLMLTNPIQWIKNMIEKHANKWR